MKFVSMPVLIFKRLLLILGSIVAIAVVAVLVCVGLFAGPTVAAQVKGQVQPMSLQQGDALRTYRLYSPANVSPRPGLIVVLQGATGGMPTGGLMEALTGLDHEADRLKWLVVYADAGRAWENGWDPYTCCEQNQDIAFFSSLIDKLEAERGVDPARVFVTGWSRGAMMSYRVGCELSSKVAAIAPVDGSMADLQGNVGGANCHPERPVSVLAINGTADMSVPIDGGHSPLNPWESISYAAPHDVVGTWRQLDGCGAQAAVEYTGPSTTTSWACQGETSVGLRVISGGDHAWPGTLPAFLVLVDLTPPQPMAGILPDSSFNASQVIADFFAAHARV